MIAFLLFSRSTLFRGAQSTLICVAVSNFVYFYTFHGLKGWTQQFYRGSTSSHSKSASTLRDLTFACAAGKYYTRTIIMKHVIWYYKFKGVTKTLDIVILVGLKKYGYHHIIVFFVCWNDPSWKLRVCHDSIILDKQLLFVAVMFKFLST